MPGAQNRRADLVSGLRARHRARSEGPTPVPDPPKALGVKAHDFADLPQLAEFRMMEAALQRFDLANPFFRSHRGKPQPEQEVEGRPVINFASYNYLGLNGDPRVTEAARTAISEWGVSPAASRVVGGERPYHRELEQALAASHGAEDAIVLVSGHATNVNAIATLMGEDDLVVLDALSHNSIIQGVKLSGAARVNFPHNDYDWLERHLARNRHRYRRVLISVEGLYSMDGDSPDLARLIEIKARHKAWLMVDEAHSFGVLGATGKGLAEAQGIDPGAVEMWMGTLSKTLGACGGYIAGPTALIAFLKMMAPGFVYSVGLSAPLAATAITALEVMQAEPERVARLQANGKLFRDCAREAGLDTGYSEGFAVTPVIVGDSLKAVALSHMLFEAGVNALPIVHPAVPEKAARVRFFLTSEHTEAQIRRTIEVTKTAVSEIEEIARQVFNPT